MRFFRRKMKSLLRRLLRRARIALYAGLSGEPRVTGRPIRLQPVLLSGQGDIRFGRNVRFGVNNSPAFWTSYAYVESRASSASIEVGDDCHFNNGVCFVAEGSSISIGRNCLFGPEVMIFDSDFHPLSLEGRLTGAPPPQKPVVIEDNVFVGARAIILKGTTIGAGSVIGAGAVVSGAFPPRSLIAGNPARNLGKL